MSELKMPRKGQSAVMLQDLNAEHASSALVEDHASLPVDGEATSNVAANARTLAGVNVAPQEDANVASNVETQPPIKKATNVTNLQPSARGRKPPVSKPQATQTEAARRAPEATPRDERLNLALQRSVQDDVTVVSVRVSVRLNAYMDDYVARVNRVDPKRKYRKQDAVAEAFASFYADHPMPALLVDDDL